jgi:hypothetical protein
MGGGGGTTSPKINPTHMNASSEAGLGKLVHCKTYPSIETPQYSRSRPTLEVWTPSYSNFLVLGGCLLRYKHDY